MRPDHVPGTPVAFHVSSARGRETVLANVSNLLADATVDLGAVAVVANGEGLDLLLAAGPQAEAVADLAGRGVRFAGCANTLERRSLGRDDLVDGVEVVPSGVGELARLQAEGYAYLRP